VSLIQISWLVAGVLWLAGTGAAQSGEAGPSPRETAYSPSTDVSGKIPDNGAHRRVVQQGLAVDFSVSPAKSGRSQPAELREGDPVTFQFQISDTTTGRPLANAHPAAWVDLLAPGQERSPKLCAEKLKAFLGGGFNSVPTSDLNVFFVVAMNADATLSVIDPLFGYGDSKLLTVVPLPAPAYDWALTADQSSIFVSLPTADQVALVDARSWTITASTRVLLRPSRLALQPDEHYLWVASSESAPDARDSGITVLTAENLKFAAHIVTGQGSHDMVFSGDSRFAFVSNTAQNTVSIVDIGTLKKIKDIATGVAPVSLAYSSKAGVVYAANQGDGTITAIDYARHLVVATIKAAPGVNQVRVSPDGRFVFAINPDKNEAYIIDSASNQLLQTFDTKTRPDQVSFTDTLAYIRHKGNDEVLMVPLDQIGKRGAPVAVADFPAGNNPPGMSTDSPADGIVHAPAEAAVLVADPKDKAIYYYREGMAAPVGTFSNYGREPRAVLVVDRSLREKSTAGLYESNSVLGRPGVYDVVFFLDSPKFVHCFPIRVETNPALNAHKPRLHFLTEEKFVHAGEKLTLLFRVVDEANQAPEVGVRDLDVWMYLAPGLWSSRQLAKPSGEPGVYTVDFAPPRPGVYYLHVSSAALGLKQYDQEYLILRAIAKDASELPTKEQAVSH
jgi:YVTN family beta-propeller protein